MGGEVFSEGGRLISVGGTGFSARVRARLRRWLDDDASLILELLLLPVALLVERELPDSGVKNSEKAFEHPFERDEGQPVCWRTVAPLLI